MTATAEHTVPFAAAVAIVLLLVAGLGGAFLRAEWLHLYLSALALPVLAQGLATGLRWCTADPMSREQL